jgi:indole-3-glycerol phosphate synthase
MASRRFSQAISEGDGISVIVAVHDAAGARDAAAQGAEAILVRDDFDGLRESTELPILWVADGSPAAGATAGADACVVRAGEDFERVHREAIEVGLDCVIQVADDEELQEALEGLDPEIFLLAPEAEDDDDWGSTFDLLAGIPAGKLAIAAFPAPSREQVIELERAGVDAVIVGARNVAELVGDAPPQV